MSCCKNMNLDEAFAYETTAQIKIKDKRLGITRMALLFFAFIYVIVYNIIISKGWAKELPVRGVSKIVGKNPTISGIDGEKNCYCYGGSHSTLCGNHTCHDSYSNFTDLPYCTDSTSPYIIDKLEMKQKRCIRIDSMDVIFDNGYSTFLSTEIRYMYQSYNNAVIDNPTEAIVKKLGKMWKETTHPFIPNFFNINFYVSDIEKYTILLEHAIVRPDDNKHAKTSSLQIDTGVLKSKNNAYCRKLYGNEQGENVKNIYKFPETTDKGTFYCDIHPKKTYDCKSCKTKTCEVDECGYDLYEVEELLLAGIVEPDGMAPVINPLDKGILKNSKYPLRGNGFIMEVFITYTDEVHYNSISTGRLTYSYSVDLLTGPPNAQSGTQQTWQGTRYVMEKHGISIKTIVDGSLHVFDPQTLLVQMTSVLGLTSIIALTIEMIMLKYLNVSGYYKSMKFSESIDYNRLKTISALKDKNLQNLSQKEIETLVDQDKRSTVWEDQTQIEMMHHDLSEKEKIKNKNSWKNLSGK